MVEVGFVLEDEDISIVVQALDDAIKFNEKVLARPDLVIDDGYRMHCEETLARYKYMKNKINS